MKPSERISEIAEQFVGKVDNATVATLLAIKYYLDEEYEKNRPCEHELELNLMLMMKECKKCHLMFA